MVVIRLSRWGSTHRPKYRITVADSRRWRDGRYLEVVGQFIPNPKGQEKELVMKLDRVNDWISKGAQPSDTVRSLVKKAGQTTQA
ncbi:MAG: 30S ribosomal protein S16 [Bdellovibrionales bacterium CG10_big_fil_rev_8_21_14_0_10_45_34]|nr:MAG: 30S ribosomal protein S16 [Bdellovibrionales bacterium CG10_big_fil_rev_8_21_14_0_10_45_34]